ncbi:hypothetical protein AWB74_02453 [Caballeronia arvi]|uniref:Uncharacterized protein n=1 Tax=Caballeronia arvi TaxID=1777135 RepID=A0A158IDJ9_9BURK|nr:hypothetical protein [Caballeronia arvi]SAL54201.1 hypothetical protein AWB74_02453 [Caballeronia arvi]
MTNPPIFYAIAMRIIFGRLPPAQIPEQMGKIAFVHLTGARAQRQRGSPTRCGSAGTTGLASDDAPAMNQDADREVLIRKSEFRKVELRNSNEPVRYERFSAVQPDYSTDD